MTDKKDRKLTTSWQLRGLRTRFRPKSRVGQGIVSAAPWVDIVFICLFIVLLKQEFVLQPGVQITLPSAEFRSGEAQRGITVVIRSGNDESTPNHREIIFFKDKPFFADTDLDKLRTEFEKTAQGDPESLLTVLADENVRYGTLVGVWNVAIDAGIADVNMGIQSLRQAAAGVKDE
jgi:biopolymer transport protein ExbD